MSRNHALGVTAVFIVFLAMASYCYATAPVVFNFGPKDSRIHGSIKYLKMWRYDAHFNVFKGVVTIDESAGKIRSVYLEIKTASLHSDCRWCDAMARSEKLLGAKQYPAIVFKSIDITLGKTGYLVKGILDLHGVRKIICFPFEAQENTRHKAWCIRGHWVLKRKDFNIVWDRPLDKGGVVVGNYMTIDWSIGDCPRHV